MTIPVLLGNRAGIAARLVGLTAGIIFLVSEVGGRIPCLGSRSIAIFASGVGTPGDVAAAAEEGQR